jgi:hypothetical protein
MSGSRRIAGWGQFCDKVSRADHRPRRFKLGQKVNLRSFAPNTYQDRRRALGAVIMSIIIGEIIGCRCWTVKHNRLASFNGYVWTIGVNKIEPEYLLDDEEDEPTEDNSVGFYSFKRLDLATKMAEYEHHHFRPIAVGSVAIWGTVVEHEKGYRSQFAKVVELNDMIGNQKSEYSWRIRAPKSRWEEGIRWRGRATADRRTLTSRLDELQKLAGRLDELRRYYRCN